MEEGPLRNVYVCLVNLVWSGGVIWRLWLNTATLNPKWQPSGVVGHVIGRGFPGGLDPIILGSPYNSNVLTFYLTFCSNHLPQRKRNSKFSTTTTPFSSSILRTRPLSPPSPSLTAPSAQRALVHASRFPSSSAVQLSPGTCAHKSLFLS